MRGLVKAVFATETLALGINMPARSVVLEQLVKWNGETHADVTPGEYTQLTGRAGRRGIDVEGHAVVVWHRASTRRRWRASPPRAPTRCAPASGRPTTWRSTWSGQVGRRRGARAAASPRSRSSRPTGPSSAWPGRCARNEEALEGYREAMTCHLGDFAEYAGLRRSLADREAALARSGAADRRAQAAASLEALRPGDVIVVPAGRRAGLAVVLDPGTASGPDDPRPTVLTATARCAGCRCADFPVAGRAAAAAADPARRSTRAPRQSGGTSPPPCATPAADRPRGRSPAAPRSAAARRRRARRSCGPGCARTPATAAPSARTTPAGPSATTGCAARPSS